MDMLFIVTALSFTRQETTLHHWSCHAERLRVALREASILPHWRCRTGEL